jgi:hypothetical protein
MGSYCCKRNFELNEIETINEEKYNTLSKKKLKIRLNKIR